MRLIDLFREVEGVRIVGDPSTEVTSLSYQSSLAGPGHVFFCVPGFRHDGHEFAADAVARGAAAVCVERELPVTVPQVVVPSVRGAMGPAASVLYEHPSARLATVGITGTNGKTTTAYLTAYLLGSVGRRAGLLGTVERRIGGVSLPTERTTPEAIDIQQDLALMVDAGDQAAVMEVSSHALALGRAAGISFSAVAFTNLTQDHLDFHGSFDSYYAAKSRLFLDPQFARNRPVAVVNVDDAFGRLLAERLPSDRLLTVSVDSEEGDAAWVAGDVGLADMTMDREGIRGVLVVRGRAAATVARTRGLPIERGAELRYDLRTGLLGRYNAANVLAALGLGVGLGLDPEAMLAALPLFPGVPGRLERIEVGQPFTVLVDYAHTPDSVENVLLMAREIAPARVIAVLGCGGDRDRGKRPKMARAAETGADLAVLTSDNPRSEDPAAILADMVAGLEHPADAVVEVDRRAAIALAMGEAEEQDMVLILGKGHETGQEFADRTVPFDDREVARELAVAHEGGRRGRADAGDTRA